MWWRITIAYAQRKQNRLFRHNAWLLNFYNDFCILVHEELIAFKYHYWMKQQESSEDSPAPKMYRWVCKTGFFLFCLLPLFTPASFTLYLRLLSFLKFFFLSSHSLSLSSSAPFPSVCSTVFFFLILFHSYYSASLKVFYSYWRERC